MLEYPQSGERIRGRRSIQSSRIAQPNRKRFAVRRIIGAGDLWVTEYVPTYDEHPSFTVSIMEFLNGKVVRESQYSGDALRASGFTCAMGRTNVLKTSRLNACRSLAALPNETAFLPHLTESGSEPNFSS